MFKNVWCGVIATVLLMEYGLCKNDNKVLLMMAVSFGPKNVFKSLELAESKFGI